jgi:hypothetical protein
VKYLMLMEISCLSVLTSVYPNYKHIIIVVYLCTYVVSIGVVITSTGTPTAGQSYSLDCSINETADPATYQWFYSNGTQLASTNQLQFSPLLASHAGTYTCRATVGSVVVENSDLVEIDRKI